MRLKLQILYIIPQNILKTPKIPIKKLSLHIPINKSISPTKFAVNGKLIFAKVNKKRYKEYNGIIKDNPP